MGVVLAACDLTVTVAKKTLLDHVHLSASPGELVAIMGPSGSGKTTLLNVLANRRDKALQVSGDILFNGDASELARLSEFSAYVMQDDHFLEFLTVLETVTFAARLRLGRRSKREQQERINFALDELGLQGCRNVLVGGADSKGISGGQRKRLSLACAILSKPELIFLDEPTSSLDASMAYDVVKTLENMAHNHRHTILCTIHQPRSQVFNLFDSLLLLRLGKTVYRGDPKEAVDWFTSIGHPCPAEFNPPDFFLDLLTESSGIEIKASRILSAESQVADPHTAMTRGGSPDLALPKRADEIEMPSGLELSPPQTALTVPDKGLPDKKGSVVRVTISAEAADQLAIAFEESEFNQAQLREIQACAKTTGEILRGDRTEFNGIYWFVRAVVILAYRDIRNKMRNPQSLIASIGQAIFMAIVLGTIFYKQAWPDTNRPPTEPDPCDSQKLRNMGGAMAQLITVLAFSAFDCAIDVIKERPLINREVAGGLYSRPARFLSNMMAGGVFHYWGILIVNLTLYWMMGLRSDAASWFTTVVLCFFLQFAAISLAKFCGYLAGSIPVAMGLLPLFGVTLFIVSGFQISDDEVPGWLIWVKDISYFRFAFQGLMRLQFKDDEYLDQCLGFRTPHNVWSNIGLVICSALGFRLVGAIAQCTMHKQVGLTA